MKKDWKITVGKLTAWILGSAASLLVALGIDWKPLAAGTPFVIGLVQLILSIIPDKDD